MRKAIFALFIFTTLAITSVTAQHFNPRLKYEGNTLGNGFDFMYKYVKITDATGGTDTVFIAPNAWQTYYSINDTGGTFSNGALKDTVTIYLGDVVRKKVTYTDNNCYKLDQITFIYKEAASAKYINYLGSFGNGGSGYNLEEVSHSDPGKTHFTTFIFDGKYFIKQ